MVIAKPAFTSFCHTCSQQTDPNWIILRPTASISPYGNYLSFNEVPNSLLWFGDGSLHRFDSSRIRDFGGSVFRKEPIDRRSALVTLSLALFVTGCGGGRDGGAAALPIAADQSPLPPLPVVATEKPIATIFGPEIYPGPAWSGVSGSGFSMSAPADPNRITAKPTCRLMTPPNQYFTDALVIGVFASANNRGTMHDNLGLKEVVVHFEGNKESIREPSNFVFSDVNGITRSYLGWWITLRKPVQMAGHANIYFEAIPQDETMQHRIVGPFQFSPQSTQHDLVLEIAATPEEIPGNRYKTLRGALDHVMTSRAQNPMIVFSEAGNYEAHDYSSYSSPGGQGYTTLSATAPVTLLKREFARGAGTTFRTRLDGLWFKGPNITIDFRHIGAIGNEGSSERQHVFEGVRFSTSVVSRRPICADLGLLTLYVRGPRII